MAKPTREQLTVINSKAQVELKEDQVFVFRSLSADTLPVSRSGWFGEYSILMSSNMLNDLKQSYKVGTGLLASHNNRRLPFGRTFDAVIQMDKVDGEDVETLYVDHYIVKYLEGENGEKVALRTEVSGMTTEDIANHISVGHAFDTSIGFVINDCKCSICKNDIRDYTKCVHIPGKFYDVQNGDKTEQVRCDLIADGGEGLEQSIVYAGAVNRALIQNGKNSYSKDNSVHTDVKDQEEQLYNVDDIKKIPINSEIFCRFSKGTGLQLFTLTPERQDYDVTGNTEGSEEMAETNTTQTTELQTQELAPMSTMFSKEDYDKVVSEKQDFEAKFNEANEKLAKATEELETANTKIQELQPQAELAEQFTKDLIEETLSAGVKARGNAFNKERFEKYLQTLSVDEIKEELSVLKGEFSAPIEDARATQTELAEDESDTVTLSYEEMKEEAGKRAMQRFKTEGGDLISLTKEELSKLQSGK